VRRRDAETVYAGLLLNVVTRFEVLVEELFFGLMAGRVLAKSCGARPRLKPANDRVVREIVLRDRDYVDWMPYKRTETLARAFLVGGLPFTAIDDGDRGRLGQLIVVRHAIAHGGKHAKAMFKAKVLGALPLPPRERTPTGFLRSQFRIAPAQTRFELYVSQIRNVAYKITH